MGKPKKDYFIKNQDSPSFYKQWSSNITESLSLNFKLIECRIFNILKIFFFYNHKLFLLVSIFKIIEIASLKVLKTIKETLTESLRFLAHQN